ncbi:Serine hydrolase FSH [Apiospora saccharicola]|uniref:Serine hydrolase FSH n=1 Tax=Apiospora saccharicola TaxID=335842 RepID=A0ABR1VAT6_9PEZI
MGQDPSKVLLSLSPTEQEAFLNGPGMKPPPNVVPDFENPRNLTHAAYVILIVCIALVAVVVAPVIYTKVVHVRKLQWEDVDSSVCSTRGQNAFYWTCLVVGWLNWLGNMTMMLLVAFGCTPTAKSWNMLLEGTCIAEFPLAYAGAILNLVFDTFTLILPQRVIWSLQLNWRKRLGISLFFALGLLYAKASSTAAPLLP